MKKNFEYIISNLKNSITPTDFFVDYPKVYLNIKDYERHLNLMNSLIGKENIEDEFIDLISYDPGIMKSIPILLATHETNFKVVNVPTAVILDNIKNKNFDIIDEQYICYDFGNINHPISDYAGFLKKSGLLDLLKNRKIKNLVDYAIGIEVGMDTNARKSRSGQIMELIVEEYIKLLSVEYHTQMKSVDIDKLYGTNLCSIGKATKKFDFVYKSKVDGKIVLMEVNYYGTQGSKPNETAKSYIELNNKVNKIANTKFVWITDGKGWIPSKNNLEDAYDEIEHLYIIKDLENGILEKL
ncbi:MAG: type II restriction endonuclease [Bacilli bacterium]|nr:type II restriction endonuclease [Bacilli bacterium]